MRIETSKIQRLLASLFASMACASEPVSSPPGGQPESFVDKNNHALRFFLDQNGNQIPVTQGATAGYVPDSACRDCHPHVYSVYQSHGMARSFYKPSVENIIEDFEKPSFHHAESNRYYETTRRGDQFYQLRYQLDNEGRRINVIERQIDYIMGSGNHVRTYMTRMPGGEIFQLPVCWYTQNGGWGMNPGYDNPYHPGFTRQTKRECMACHNAFPETPDGGDNRDHGNQYPAELPEGIGCQRCHGPGAEHIRATLDAQATIRSMRASIVNPARLDQPLREDVCMQCHLQPTSHANSFARLDGHGEYSIRPGEPLSKYVMVVDYNSDEDRAQRFEINHHPYRLHRSQCYIESKGRMDCLTCHDPHRKIPKSERTDHYRRRCLTCHKIDDCGVSHMADGSERVDRRALQSNDCVACHMPPRRTEDVIQVIMTDHLIRRAPAPDHWLAPRSELRVEVSFPPEPYHPDRTPPQPMLDVYLAMFGVPRGDPVRVQSLERAMEKADTTAFDPAYELAQGYGEIGAFSRARKAMQVLANEYPDRPRLWSSLAYFEAQDGHDDDALLHARHALTLDPDAPETHALLGGLYLSSREISKAIAHLMEAVRLRPLHVDALMNLGSAHAQLGELSRSAEYLRTALAVDPTDIEAYVQIGVVLIAAGELAEAIRYVTHGLRVTEGSAELAVVRAASLALDRQFSAARVALDEARKRKGDRTSLGLIQALCDWGKVGDANMRAAFDTLRARVVGNTNATPLQRILVSELDGALERRGTGKP